MFKFNFNKHSTLTMPIFVCHSFGYVARKIKELVDQLKNKVN